jgi:hypothetical protein
LLREVQQWVGLPSAPLHLQVANESNAGGQVCPHPFVATGDNEVGDRQAVIQGEMAKGLSRIDEHEVQFAPTPDLFDNLSNRESDAQVIDGWQEQTVATVGHGGLGQRGDDVIRRPAATKDVVP